MVINFTSACLSGLVKICCHQTSSTPYFKAPDQSCEHSTAKIKHFATFGIKPFIFPVKWQFNRYKLCDDFLFSMFAFKTLQRLRSVNCGKHKSILRLKCEYSCRLTGSTSQILLKISVFTYVHVVYCHACEGASVFSMEHLNEV